MKYIIYKITNKINNKIYIGAHKTRNLNDDYMGSGKYLIRAINKYGLDNFKKEVLNIFSSSEEMYAKEAKIVTEEFISREDVYNLKIGGEGGFDYINNSGLGILIQYQPKRDLTGKGFKIHLDKLKSDIEYKKKYGAKLSAALKKHYLNNTGHFAGKKHTEKSKKKISEANKINQIGSNNSQYGTVWISNLNDKISKRIKKEEFEIYLEAGWIKKRVIDWDKLFKQCKYCKIEFPSFTGKNNCSKKCSINSLKKYSKISSGLLKGQQKGKNSVRWKGYWVTPKGKFETLKEAGIANNCSDQTIFTRCKKYTDKFLDYSFEEVIN